VSELLLSGCLSDKQDSEFRKELHMQNDVTIFTSCPFCDSKSVCLVATGTKKTRYYIECQKCGSRTATVESKLDAVSRWNARPTVPHIVG